MAESNRDVAKRIFDRADMAATMVASLVGWFLSTLDPAQRAEFEQLIEVQCEIAAEPRP